MTDFFRQTADAMDKYMRDREWDRLMFLPLKPTYEPFKFDWYTITRDHKVSDKFYAIINGFHRQLAGGDCFHKYPSYSTAQKAAEELSAKFPGIDFFVVEAKAKVNTPPATKVTAL